MATDEQAAMMLFFLLPPAPPAEYYFLLLFLEYLKDFLDLCIASTRGPDYSFPLVLETEQ